MNIIKRFFKWLFRRPAIFFVTLWAKRAWKEGVAAAERRHLLEGGNAIYLASENFHPDRLKTYNKRQFKIEKRIYGFHARLLTMNTLKAGCYYYTADRFGRNGMSEKDKEIRRRFFIKERLEFAGLLG